MAPTIILIRHAEAIHNITKNYTTHDPPLTDHGITTQCDALSQALQNHPLASKIDLIVTSPLTRTLQTTQSALSFLISRGVPVIPLAELQETTTNPIDCGRPLAELTPDFPSPPFNWTHMSPLFPSKTGPFAFSPPSLLSRGAATRAWLRARPEQVIAVVSHAGFMRIGLCNCKFGNADFRVFGFGEGGALVEWEETRERGGGLGGSEGGFFGWEVNDFKYMPGYEGKTREELLALCSSTPLR